jgi:hypothetical protein
VAVIIILSKHIYSNCSHGAKLGGKNVLNLRVDHNCPFTRTEHKIKVFLFSELKILRSWKTFSNKQITSVQKD